jgi:hypothetical protein
MSIRVDSNSLIAGAVVVGNRGLGVLGSSVPSTGENGASFLYNDLVLPADNNVEVRGLIATPPSAGSFVAYEDGSFDFVGAPDGVYSFSYRLFADGVDRGVVASSLTVGVVSTVSGVTVSPATPSVAGGATQQFTAAVAGTGSPSQAVAWSTNAGSINSSGLFTAPAATSSAQTITITATSTQDNTKSGTATVTVPAASTVSGVTVGPSTATLAGAGTQQFAATLTGTGSPSQAVTWQASAGSITSGGMFTAPAETSSNQIVTVTATSVLDNTKAGTSTVTVPAAAPVGSTVSGVTVSPASATVTGGANQAFTASVQGTNSPSQAVLWSVTGGGSITSGGVYTAPATADGVQSPVVTATSFQDNTKSGTAAVTVPATLPTATSPSIFSVAVPTNGDEGILAEFPKQPAEVMDYDVSFVDYLAILNDTVDGVTVSAEEGIALVEHSVSSGVVKVWAGEGTSLTKYKFTIRMTTAGGRVKEVEIVVRVKDT